MTDALVILLQQIPLLNAGLSVVLLWLMIRVYAEVRRTNGRLARLETWRDEHNKQDDERHDALCRAVERAGL